MPPSAVSDLDSLVGLEEDNNHGIKDGVFFLAGMCSSLLSASIDYSSMNTAENNTVGGFQECLCYLYQALALLLEDFILKQKKKCQANIMCKCLL